MSKSSQSGNVLFLILICVALFAALSWVVTQGSRSGSGAIDREDMIMKFNQVQAHVNNVRTALMHMRSRGMPMEQINFSYSGFVADYSNPNCTKDECMLFHPAGGHAIWYQPPERINDGTEYYITGNTQVNNVGMTNMADSTATELILILPNIPEKACQLINSQMRDDINMTPPSDSGTCVFDPVAPGFLYKGSFTAGNLLNGPDGRINNTYERCVRCDNGTYHYYSVLLSR